jgi:hypothetical protein
MNELNIRSSTLAILSFIFLLHSNVAYCGLGDTLVQAKSKTLLYKQRYGAVAPLFKTDKNGKVIWECWAAPPRMWTKKEAMEFVKNLLPNSLKNETPKIGTKDGIYEPYIYSDGTMIILSGFNGKYYWC